LVMVLRHLGLVLIIVVILVAVSLIGLFPANARTERALPFQFRDNFMVETVLPVRVGGVEYYVYQLLGNFPLGGKEYIEVQKAILIQSGLTTYYFKGGDRCFWVEMDPPAKSWGTHGDGRTVAYLNVASSTGGMGYGGDQHDVLEMSVGGVRSLLGILRSEGLQGTIVKLVSLDSRAYLPQVLLLDDSLFTTNVSKALPFPLSKSSFPGFPKVLQVEPYGVHDITSELEVGLKQDLIKLAESAFFTAATSIIWEEGWDLPDSGASLSVSDMLSISEFPYDPDALSFAVSVLATYYAVGWPEEGEKRFAELIAEGDWSPGFTKGIDTISVECINTVRLLFEESSGVR